ncbi:Succinate dehydrogenase subunit 7b protein [Thalictrum thalictroides]|uniref:Succinate dehydrogenase subunit 7b protein n=1 Tax=Thalictrum thalictroides TaxID=46969 RepID=A0A7J6VCU3_THATH|nr:Succinate dehydrogenase subunit 7b protein [Thalictrum thalictroides]
MAFFLNKTSLLHRIQSPKSQNALLQPKRGYHIEPGTREKALLLEDPVLKRFKSHKRNVHGLKRMGDVLAVVVAAGCCYMIYVKSVMREEARKGPRNINEGL